MTGEYTRERRTDETAVVPNGGPSRDYTCVRSLKRRGVAPLFAHTDTKSVVLSSRYCGETLPLPSPTEALPAYRDALLDVAARPDVETIVPTREVVVYLLSKYSDSFRDHVSLVVPPFETLRTATDRLRLADAAEKARVPVPETRLLTEVDDWDRRQIVKSRCNLLVEECVDGFSSQRAGSVDTVKHLPPGERPNVAKIIEEMDHVPITQEFVPTDGEYVFAALYDHGEPVATFQHRQIRGDSYIGGGGVYRKSVFVEELETVARRLLDHLEWHGLACIEYMRHATTGEFVLTEINPRMWKSLPTAVRAGADFPAYYWLAATGRVDTIEPGYDLGVGTHSLYGEVNYLLNLLQDSSPHVDRPGISSTVRSVLSSIYEEPSFDYTRLDDPGPFLRGAALVLRNLLR